MCYEKLHITPNEKKYWGIKGGNGLKVFETDCAKIGILICYDVEFPELGRLLAVLIVDLDLDLLKHLHSNGSVTNLKDRRLDLYSLIKSR